MSRRPSRLSVLLGRETLVGLLLVLLASAICVSLGFWQFGRFEGKRDAAAVIESHYEAEPVPLADVLPSPDFSFGATDDWTPVELRGSYCTDPDCVLYVRNRQLQGSVGFWQLVPFTTDEGSTLLVVRGWVNSQSERSAPADPAPVPEGELSLTVRLRPAEPVLDREIPEGQVHSVNPPQIEGLLPAGDGEMITDAYGDLAAEEPESPRPVALPEPDRSLGPHLSYAVQWWAFALFFPGALIYRTRRTLQDLEADENAPDDAGTPLRENTDHRPRRPAPTRRRGLDEEEEDALIDHRDR
ncbi:SURF1 family protein [Brachybacterium sacelli]|uniref:SURF1-like protein n=1 Tax=Brachybacterium sacelli TaxID=173364 RepID=A0ABS4X9H6_9MICO|nr:SURF1 family protein [Brachybacterium sacelli]MBP2384324.1 cytochrome oxidase assembly protein ShyY1 [Brachybacterium sacelli]